jgi:hypothetical protein
LSYLIRLARNESTISILKSHSKDEEEDRRPQTSPQGAVSAAHQLAWPVSHGSVIKQFAVAHIFATDILRSPATGDVITAGR